MCAAVAVAMQSGSSSSNGVVTLPLPISSPSQQAYISELLSFSLERLHKVFIIFSSVCECWMFAIILEPRRREDLCWVFSPVFAMIWKILGASVASKKCNNHSWYRCVNVLAGSSRSAQFLWKIWDICGGLRVSSSLAFFALRVFQIYQFFALFWGSLLAVEWIVVVLSLSQWCQCMTPIGIFFFLYPGAGAFTGRCRSYSAADAGGCCWTLQGIHCCSRCSPAYKPWNHFCGSAFEILGNENSLLSGAADRLTQWYVFWLICHDDTHILLSETY